LRPSSNRYWCSRAVSVVHSFIASTTSRNGLATSRTSERRSKSRFKGQSWANLYVFTSGTKLRRTGTSLLHRVIAWHSCHNTPMANDFAWVSSSPPEPRKKCVSTTRSRCMLALAAMVLARTDLPTPSHLVIRVISATEFGTYLAPPSTAKC
jgi:hypothetical protein